MPIEIPISDALNEDEKIVLVWLLKARGKENAIKRESLAGLCALPERTVRDVIHNLIVTHGYPICSKYGGQGGYYMAESSAELTEVIDRLHGHGISILTHQAGLKKAREKYFGEREQLTLTEGL